MPGKDTNLSCIYNHLLPAQALYLRPPSPRNKLKKARNLGKRRKAGNMEKAKREREARNIDVALAPVQVGVGALLRLTLTLTRSPQPQIPKVNRNQIDLDTNQEKTGDIESESTNETLHPQRMRNLSLKKLHQKNLVEKSKRLL